MMDSHTYKNQKNCIVIYNSDGDQEIMEYEIARTMEVAEAIFEEKIDKLPEICLSSTWNKQTPDKYLLTYGNEEIYYSFFKDLSSASETLNDLTDSDLPMLYSVENNTLTFIC